MARQGHWNLCLLPFSTSCCFGSCSRENQTVSQDCHHPSRLDSLAWVNIFCVALVHTCWWVLGGAKRRMLGILNSHQQILSGKVDYSWNKGNSTVHNQMNSCCPGCPVTILGFRSCGPVDPKVLAATSIHLKGNPKHTALSWQTPGSVFSIHLWNI